MQTINCEICLGFCLGIEEERKRRCDLRKNVGTFHKRRTKIYSGTKRTAQIKCFYPEKRIGEIRETIGNNIDIKVFREKIEDGRVLNSYMHQL